MAVLHLEQGEKNGRFNRYEAGILLKKKAGDAVEPGEPIALLFTDRENAVSQRANAFQTLFPSPLPDIPKPVSY